MAEQIVEPTAEPAAETRAERRARRRLQHGVPPGEKAPLQPNLRAPTPGEDQRVMEAAIGQRFGAGRTPAPPVGILDVAELTRDELQLMAKYGAGKTGSTIKTMRMSHHAVARYMALGYRPFQIARLTGYTPNTVRTLSDSPAFRELIEHYSREVDARLFNFKERLEVLAEDSIDRIHSMIRDDDDLAPEFIRKVMNDSLDRSGHAPVLKSEVKSSHIVMTKADLDEIKSEANDEERGTVVRTSFERQAQKGHAALASVNTPHRGTGMGEDPPPKGKSAPQAGPTEGSNGTGEGV